MPTIDYVNAERLAREYVDQRAREDGDVFELLLKSTQSVKQGWVFFYNTADFVRTGEISHALAGNGPLLVRFDGTITELPTAFPWQEALSKLT